MKTRTIGITLIVLCVLLVSVAAAPVPPPAPTVTFTVLMPLPETMTVGQSYDFVVQVTSDIEFLAVMAMPDLYYPGRYVVSHGASRTGAGTTATLTVTFTAKASTAGLPGGVAPVAVVVGPRFKGGVVIPQRYDYNVNVIP